MNQVPSKRMVLVVDDQEINRELLTALLASDYEVITATDGGEACATLKEKKDKLSAVITDLVMPVMDGFELLQWMRERGMDFPVIVMSQENSEEAELQALEAGAADFVAKPYHASVLRHRLLRAIRLYEASQKIDVLQRDELTGLYTKAAFTEYAEHILQTQTDKQWNLIAIDIDRFKLVNESYGYEVGNALLVHLGKILGHYAKVCSMICARSYADHFFLLAERHDYSFIKQCYDEIAEHMEKFSVDMKVEIKLGVYQINDPTMEISSMCDRAHLAIDQIKGQYVREISFYDDSLREQLVREQWILDDMEEALREHQFQVYFQPKYDIFTETLSGAEALVRWIHPQRGFMSPGEFIPIFEKNGFITDVDMFVWDETCKKIREWIDRFDCYVPISVNVSRKDVYKPNIGQILLDTVHRNGLEPRHLHLEITESAYVENPEQLLSVVEELKGYGFKIEMDDFGSGYSSLNMLASMPIDMLKLDMNFVKNYSEENNSRGIMSFVIGLAKWMNLYVVAEGVETQEQLELLRGMDCNLAQGYYFSKPLPAADFERVLREFGQNLENISDQSIRMSTAHEGEYQTMLIIDGLAVNRAIITGYLEDSYSIVEASGGKAALQYLKHVKRADMVLMDAHLPDMEASELIREIKKDPLMERIPIVVTTHGSDDTVKKILEAGADAYITKPYRQQQLYQCLNRVMSAQGERLKQEEKQILDKIRVMEMLSTKDYLTGLWNRVELERRIEEHIKHSPDSEFYLISVDIDNYKAQINKHGYSAGDKILHEVANRMAGCFSDRDAVGRITGDRFGIFLDEALDNDELLVRMMHLQSELNFNLEDIKVTCSSGVSKYPDCGRTFDELYRHAELAMEQAKSNGKNTFLFCEQCSCDENITE